MFPFTISCPPVELTPSVALSIVGAALLLVWFRRNRKPCDLPPGPPSFPLIGSLLSLRSADIREELCRLARYYGDIYTLDLGCHRTVILASHEVIKEALIKNGHALSGRPMDLFVFKELTKGRGVLGTQGPIWQEHRKFIQGVFREFGVGRPVFEEKIQEEIACLLEVLRDHLSRPYDPSPVILKAVSNVINSVIFGRRYDYGDACFIRHVATLEANMRILGNGGALSLFPFLRHLPGDFFKFKQLLKQNAVLEEDIRQRIDQHRSTRETGAIRDLIDAYQTEADRRDVDPYDAFTDEQLTTVVTDLFGGGTETTNTTLRWALLYLLHHPEVQQRVHREIDDVIGSSRMPSVKDKLSMPYTEAVLCEVQRMGDIVPLGAPHCATEDVWVRGHRIPRGTQVITLLYAAHRDPQVWENPHTFDPSRFLDKDGRVCKNERLIPFSMGRRVCLGESLARMELFLFFVALLQNFSFRLPPGDSLPALKGTLGLTYAPVPYEIVIETRI